MLEKTKITGFADEIHKEIKVQVGLLKELGISYLELRSVNGKNIADFTLEEAGQLKEYLDKEGIRVSAIGSPIGKIGITEEFEEHYKTYQRVVDIAKLLETPYIRIFSFYIPEGEEADAYEEEVFSRMRRLADYAKTQQVVLLHENEKGIYGDTADRCRRLFEEFFGEFFQCTFDFANFVQCSQDTLKAYELLESYIAYIHIKDARRKDGTVTPAGEGDGNVLDILRKLAAKDYEGFLSLEPHLSEFDALKTLEKNPEKRALTDGEAAFTTAYLALQKLLKEK